MMTNFLKKEYCLRLVLFRLYFNDKTIKQQTTTTALSSNLSSEHRVCIDMKKKRKRKE